MKKKKQKKTDAAGKYTRPAAGPGGSGPGISSGPYGGAQQLPALQTIPFQPLQIQQEPMQPLPLAPGCERGASRGTKERTPADPAGICGATFERSENGGSEHVAPSGGNDRLRRFLRSKNRVENEEASIRARKLQKATTAKQRCGAAKPGPRSRRPHRGISRSEMPRPILRGKPKRRKGRTRPFRLRRSGTRPKGGRRGAPPRRTLTPPVHRARRSCCRRRRARPYRCWCGPWTTKTPRCPSGWTRQRPYWTAYTARPRSPLKGTAAPRYRS